MAQSNGYKICNKCGKKLELNSDNFSIRKSTPTGFDYTCKKCNNEKRKKPLKDGEIINPITGQRIQDMTKMKFERLTPIKLDMNRMDNSYKEGKRKVIYWLCKCDCGNKELVSVSTQSLKNKGVMSCGCLQKETMTNIHKKNALKNISIADYIINKLCGNDETKLCEWWDFKKNDELGLNPYEIAYKSNKKVWIFCREREYHGSYLVPPTRIVRGCKCPYCSSHKVHSKDSLGQYITDNYGQDFLNKIWSDKNEKSPFKYSIGTEQRVWWNCECGKHSEYKRNINSSKRFEFRCPQCGDIIKYPNKLMQNILEQLDIEFIPEYSPDWIKPKRYDFYIPSLSLIIEMDGGFHFKDNNMSGQTKEKSLEIDNYKDKIAREYGIEVIRIDCRKSELDFIKNNILNSKLNILFDINKINWVKCTKHSLVNVLNNIFKLYNEGKTPKEINKITGISVPTIREHLKNNPNYLGIKVLQKPVKCMETNDVFNSIEECSSLSEEKFGVKISRSGISKVCRKQRKTCHKFHFEFIEEVEINE